LCGVEIDLKCCAELALDDVPRWEKGGGPVAAKPRVHEIASEFGVHAKIALQILKEDGEFLKGPSSSIEPPVARRLRARLRAEGYGNPADQAPTPAAVTPAPTSNTSRPIPAPPGTRWRAEPFVPYTKPGPTPKERAEAGRAGQAALARRASQELAGDAIRAERQVRRVAEALARGEAAAKARWQATRQEEAAAHERGGRMATEHAVRVARKKALLVKKALQEKESRTAREATRLREALRAPALTEDESRTKARKAIVTRPDSNWGAYGFGAPERRGWERAGLSTQRAHIAAMCQTFYSRGWSILPSHLQIKFQSGLTVRQAFEAGSNIVQVIDQLAAVSRRDITGVYDTSFAAVVPALRESAPEPLHISAPIPRDLEAKGVPQLAEYLVAITGSSPGERAVDAFNRERRQFERTERPGPLVKLYAEAHGVFSDLDLTRKLMKNVPLHVADRVMRQPFANLLTDALKERQFYYLSPAATEAIEGDTDNRIPVPEEYDLPTPTGFALLRDEDGGSRILIWSHGAGELTATLLPVADLAAGLTEYPDVRTAPTGSVSAEGAEVALALVAAIGVATRRTPSGDLDADARRAPQRLAGGPGKLRPVKRPVDEFGEPADFVSLIYAPGEAHFEEVTTGTGRKAEKRWVVRGHWRQQWYSSTGQRHPLWIRAHEAGVDEGELLTRDRVRVTRYAAPPPCAVVGREH
jgi:hypothetical protein